MEIFIQAICVTVALAAAHPQGALLGEPYGPSNFVEPAGWSVGDEGSTHQIWDQMYQPSGNTPDLAYVVNPAGIDVPTLNVNPPGFASGSGNFYSFGGNYSVFAELFNHTYGPSYGTHVIVQTSATMNPDEGSGGPASVFPDTIEIVRPNGDPIPGGGNANMLRSEVIWQRLAGSGFGEVTLEEMIFEFYLPEYTGDYRVQWGEIVHSSFDSLRVDSMATETAFPITPLPPPVKGDYDGDLDVDLDDFMRFAECHSGPGVLSEDPFCLRFDFDSDEDSDLADFAAMTLVWSPDE